MRWFQPFFGLTSAGWLMLLPAIFAGLFCAPPDGHAQTSSWISFENDESAPFYGFTAQERGGTYGMTLNLDRNTSPVLFGEHSAYLSESWDRVSIPTGLGDGLVQVWFYDPGYGLGADGTQTAANALRLRSVQDDPARDTGWPLYYLTVDLKGQHTGHGRTGFMREYSVAQNDDPAVGMGVTFGFPAASVNADFYRTTDTWHLVCFDIDGGKTTVAVDGEMADIVETHELCQLELLCRSGWYQSRPGEANVMCWDGIAFSPKIYSTDFSSTPTWMTFTEGSALDFATTRTAQTVPFGFIPGSSKVARMSGGGQKMSVPWNVQEGSVEIWFWDNMANEGGNPDNGSIDIIVSAADSPTSFTRMRTYESAMGKTTTVWYLSRTNTMGSSYSLARRAGWNKMVFHKNQGVLRVSLNGCLVTQSAYCWTDPPKNMILELSSRSGYNDGFPLWLGRIAVAGADRAVTPSAAAGWAAYQ